MEVTLLGTGCPICDPDRFGPANLVRHAGRAYLVDCGSGATQRLVSAGTPGKLLDAVFLTHLHSDHIVDLYQLVITSWHQGRDRKQRIFGPVGTKRFVDGVMALWRPELDQRIAHEKRPSTVALEIEVTEIEAGEIYRDGDLVVTAVRVDHQPVREAFGFVFAAGGKRLAFSGDTARSERLIAAARGADVLVHECFLHHEMKVTPGVRSAETVASVASYHTLSSEVGKIATEAGVACLVLNHFVPTRFDKLALLREVAADYAGPIVVGEDLLSIDVDTGIVRHAGASLALGRPFRADAGPERQPGGKIEMTLKIYGIAKSRAFRNLWACAELGLPYEQVPIDFTDGPNGVGAPSFKAVNPMGEIPAIDDDGFRLSESLAINLYLARKQGGPLYPTTLHGEAKVWQWTLWVATAVEPHVNTMATHRVYRAPADRDESIALAAQASLALPLGVLAGALAATGSLVGNAFTIADLNVATVLYSARNVGLDLAAVPGVTAWLDRCLDRPGAKVARKMREQ